MVQPPNRRQPLPEEKQTTINAGLVLGALQGLVPQAAPVSSLERAAAQARATAAVSQQSRRHHSQVLKAEGVAPAGSYALAFQPADQPHWPQVFAAGALQLAEVDYTTSGQTLTVLPAMDLQTDELLYCDYDYDTGQPFSLGLTLVDFAAAGWTYKFVTADAEPGFEAPAYDDSAWSTGAAPFGSGTHTGLPAAATAWSASKQRDVLLRRSFGALSLSEVTVQVRYDDNFSAYWNGDLIGSISGLHNATEAGTTLAVPGTSLGGDNVLAVRVRDRDTDVGVRAYADVKVMGVQA